jgi:hypothetical protein
LPDPMGATPENWRHVAGIREVIAEVAFHMHRLVPRKLAAPTGAFPTFQCELEIVPGSELESGCSALRTNDELRQP